tara:strand:+ start:787 stop:1080 length:294 start_codon:yes stop_codon:yes gene_type:complete
MANQRLIYSNSDGTMSVFIPTTAFLSELDGTDEEKAIILANKQLPTGTKYEIIADSVDLSDRTFRDAWVYTADASVERTSADLSDAELTKWNMPENI